MPAAEVDALVALDANFLIAARIIGSKEGLQLEAWLREGSVILMCALAWSEYLCGPPLRDDLAISRRFIRAVEPIIERDAEVASELFNDTGRRSRSHVDCIIAAHAIRREAILATRNVQDFRPFTKFGLSLA